MHDATKLVKLVSIFPTAKLAVRKKKHIMITRQNIANKISPYKMIAVQPQGCNELCDEYASDFLKMISNHKDYELIGISSDSLSSEGHLIKEQAVDF